MITIEYDDSRVMATLDRLLQAVADPKPAYRDIGEYLVRSTKQRGGAGTAPDGTPWAALSPITIERKGNATPLVGESKRLLSEIHYRVTNDGVEVGSPMECSPHSRGSTDELSAETVVGGYCGENMGSHPARPGWTDVPDH
jgi:phage gpG-like protein